MRCSLSATQLDRVLSAALRKRSGFELGADHVPTHAKVLLSTNLLCLSLNLTDNALYLVRIKQFPLALCKLK